MPATITRRTLRRARLGGRHTYRAAMRHPALLIVAGVAAVTMGAGIAAAHDAPTGFGGMVPPAHAQPHGPMMGGPHPGPWDRGRN